nr:MAG TPA: hypothetical protein [Inoviridae sp.]
MFFNLTKNKAIRRWSLTALRLFVLTYLNFADNY